MEPKRVLPGTKKGLYLEPKRVLLWGQPKNTFGTLFSKSVVCVSDRRVRDTLAACFTGTWERVITPWSRMPSFSRRTVAYQLAQNSGRTESHKNILKDKGTGT